MLRNTSVEISCASQEAMAALEANAKLAAEGICSSYF